MGIYRENLRKRIKHLQRQKQALNHEGARLTSKPLVLAGSAAHARAIEQQRPHRVFEMDEPPPGGIVGVESE